MDGKQSSSESHGPGDTRRMKVGLSAAPGGGFAVGFPFDSPANRANYDADVIEKRPLRDGTGFAVNSSGFIYFSRRTRAAEMLPRCRAT